jgi:dihydroxyacetone kinase
MTHLYNDPLDFKEEMLAGYVNAYSRFVRRIPNASGVMALAAPQAGKVSTLIGGGSGHYPAFCGYVGPGLADAAAMGEIFTSPSAEQVYRCTKAVAADRGVLYVYGNYSGDVLNFDMAAARCLAEGIDVRSVLVTDDVASAPQGDEENRRGIAGDFFVFKAAGAAAARGDALNDVEAMTRHANAQTRSFGIAFDGCTLPGQPAPLFTVESGRMELGLGVHGEPGIRSAEIGSPLGAAREVAALLVETVLQDAPRAAGSRAAVLVNGLGSTQYEEMFVLYRDIHSLLVAAGIQPYRPIVDEMVTSLNMAGCSLSLMWLDGELQSLLDAPCLSAAYTQSSI